MSTKHTETRFFPEPNTRRRLAFSRKLCRNRKSLGPYTWCGATATVNNVSPSHAAMHASSPLALLSAYACRKRFG